MDPTVWGIAPPQDRSRPAGPVWAHVSHRVGRLLMPLPRRRIQPPAIAQGLKNDAACWTELTKVAKTVEAKANDDATTALTAAAGVADPNVASQWMTTSNNPPLTFLELSELVFCLKDPSESDM